MKQPDIVEQLRQAESRLPRQPLMHEAADIIDQLRQRLFELGEELETWRNRYEAERQDHEATMKAWDEERSGM